MNSTKLTETYVKEYYNRGLESEEDYSDFRWFRSKESRFDYEQTKLSILHALENKKYTSVLEVGPGDGIWTEFVIKNATSYTLLDQSTEMLRLARKRLQTYENATYIENDFATYELQPATYDLVMSVRCFEYITDKEAAVNKMYQALVPGGTLVLVTKNKNYISLKRKAKNRSLLHSEQISRKEMLSLLRQSGFVVEAAYSSVLRWKAKYWIFRLFFNLLQTLSVKTNGRVRIPWLSDAATESYTYVAVKKKS